MTEAKKTAGNAVAQASLINVSRAVTAYFTGKPDTSIPSQRVAFGTSGHRGSALLNSFNENHILAISQAICLHRAKQGITGPLFIGIDTHALSEPALASALEVFAANEIEVMLDAQGGYTPTPALSHAILCYNKNRSSGFADGVGITPSHNPPEDGGFKYNPPNGGPADTETTTAIERCANEFLAQGLNGVRRIPYERARTSSFVHAYDYVSAYTADLVSVIDMEAISKSGVRIGIDPLGGASVDYWQPIIDRYGLTASIVNTSVDQTFRFMPADWDGKIRMDCSSPHAMANLIKLRSEFDVAFAQDTDADRHGIVTASAGLMNPNHYLAVAISHLYKNRPDWNSSCGIGKTMVSSAVIDRVAAQLDRKLVEVPVGFKWFVEGLESGSLGFGGEESAGASFLRKDRTVWTTDKDGIILCLLSAEITARTGRDVGEVYKQITDEVGASFYERIDAPASAKQKSTLKSLSPEQISSSDLAGDPIRAKLTNAPGNGASFGGLKVTTDHGWFAARPSGTEDVYKIYAESFRSEDHLRRIQEEAQTIISDVFAKSGT